MNLVNMRLRLAQFVAPPGADVHDPDATACPSDRVVLEGVAAYELCPDSYGRALLDVTETAQYAEEAGWIQRTTDHDGIVLFQLTVAGEAELRRTR